MRFGWTIRGRLIRPRILVPSYESAACGSVAEPAGGSEAAPSNSTWSGTTIAHQPLAFSNVSTYCRKFNRLFLVVIQRSGRS